MDQRKSTGSGEYQHEGTVARIALRSPVLDVATKSWLLAALTEAAADEAVRAVVLTGSGRAFCLGQHLGEHAEALRSGPEAAFATLSEHYGPIVTLLSTMAKPVIAAINGTCVGAGLSLALACDLRIARSGASFATAFTGIGLSFDSGLSASLARAVGAARASELILLGEAFTAEQALAWGVVGSLADESNWEERVSALAGRLAAGPTQAYAEAKLALAQSWGANLPQVLAAEQAAQQRLGATADHRNAVEAFLAKRRPEFTGSPWANRIQP